MGGSEGGRVFIWRVAVGGADDELGGQTVTSFTIGSEDDDVGALCFLNQERHKV